jgi:hypothetical protein
MVVKNGAAVYDNNFDSMALDLVRFRTLTARLFIAYDSARHVLPIRRRYRMLFCIWIFTSRQTSLYQYSGKSYCLRLQRPDGKLDSRTVVGPTYPSNLRTHERYWSGSVGTLV